MPDEAHAKFAKVTPEEHQRRLRLFIKDAVKSTIGLTRSLDEWVAQAIYEKLYEDIGGFYNGFGRKNPDTVQKVALQTSESHHGLLYLHKHQTVVLLKVVSRHLISVMRASEAVHPDRQAAQQIAAELTSAGLPCTASSVFYVPFDSNNESDLHLAAYHSKPEEEERTRVYASALMQATVTRSSARDVQKLPGPSDLANGCDLCVARRIASSCGIDMPQLPRHFSLKAWVGTAIHQKIERDLPGVYPYAQQEITVPISVVPGLGSIKGHVDAYFPRKLVMGDWKSTDMKKLDKITKFGVPSSHFGQTMLYMYGLRKKGLSCDYATLTYIPRDSNNVSDIWVASCAYREDVAVGLLNRTRSLLNRLQEGDVANLQSDPECFVCHVQHRIRR